MELLDITYETETVILKLLGNKNSKRFFWFAKVFHFSSDEFHQNKNADGILSAANVFTE